MDEKIFFNLDILKEFKDAIGFQNIQTKSELGDYNLSDNLPLSMCSGKNIDEIRNYLSINMVKEVNVQDIKNKNLKKGIIVEYDKTDPLFSVKYLNPTIDPNTIDLKDINNYTEGPVIVDFKDIYFNDNSLRKYLLKTLNSKSMVTDFIVIFDTYKNISGVLVVQKGECPRYPTYWNLRIICNLNKPECKGYVLILMGAYMYMLKKKNNQEYGILELAEGYNNLDGYCTYTKFGFVPNPNFGCSPPFRRGKYCPKTGKYISGNLKMLSTISKISLDQIIDISKKGTKFPIPRPLICNREAFLDDKEQKIYAKILQEDYDREEQFSIKLNVDNTENYLFRNSREKIEYKER